MNKRKPSLLIVDDNVDYAASLGHALQDIFEIDVAHDAEQAESRLVDYPSAAIVDICLSTSDPDNRDGLHVLDAARRISPRTVAVVLTGHSDVDLAVECMKRGALDFLAKIGLRPAELRLRLESALAQRGLRNRIEVLEDEIRSLEPRIIVGRSAAIQRVRERISALAADGDATVLILGESGTGKELAAREIQRLGRRAENPLVAVSINAFAESTLEAELFGHEPGAYTDARERRIGHFERADRGVLLLDDVGEIPMHLQVKLLRFLEEREIVRLGGAKPVPVDVQVLAASNVDLHLLVREGRFREDLYYRLSVHEVVMPPLRDRRDDIVPLAEYFVRELQRKGKRTLPISSEACEHMKSLSYPGNVRQLRNSVEASMFNARARGGVEVLPEDIPRPASMERATTSREASQPTDLPIDELLARVELGAVERALERGDQSKTQLAADLGYRDRFAIHRRILRLFEQNPSYREYFSRTSRTFAARGPES